MPATPEQFRQSADMIHLGEVKKLPWLEEGLGARQSLGDCPTCGPQPPLVVPFDGREYRMKRLCPHQDAARAAAAKASALEADLTDWRNRFGRWAPPADFRDLTLAAIDPEREGSRRGRAFVEHYVAEWPDMWRHGRGMVFHGLAESAWGNPGGIGTGKTLCASVIAALLEARGVPVAWVKCRELIDALRDFSGAKGVVTAAMRRAGLLILDELVNEHETAYTAQEVIAALDARYEAGLPTLITTNFDVAAVGRHYEAILTKGADGHTPAAAQLMVRRFLSRLQPPRFVRVEFDGPDQRHAQRSTWGPTFD